MCFLSTTFPNAPAHPPPPAPLYFLTSPLQLIKNAVSIPEKNFNLLEQVPRGIVG